VRRQRIAAVPTGLAVTAALAVLAGGCFKADINVSGNGSGDRSSQLPSGSWEDYADLTTSVLLGAEKGILFSAFDTLAYPGRPVELTVRLRSSTKLAGLKGVEVGFYEGAELLGTDETDESGYAAVDWTPPKLGDFPLTARILAGHPSASTEDDEPPSAPLLVAARQRDEPIVVIDLDHTLVDASFARVLLLGGSARPMAESLDVTKAIAEGHTIVYLTQRPDLLCRKSKVWLERNGYPLGVLLVSSLGESFGGNAEYKSGRLADLRKRFPNVRAGIGDKVSDAQAYVDNGLTAFLIPHVKDKPKDMRKAAREIRALRGRGRLHVVSNWGQIREGFFHGKAFPPGAFADALEARARRIEAEERRRKREEDEEEEEEDD
jgi:hypothetical protein